MVPSFFLSDNSSIGWLLSLVFALLLILAVLLSIAFFTVFERKVLAAVQGRKGPNFVGFMGILQAIADGLKLFLKETTIPNRASKFLFVFSPIFMFFLSLCGWLVVPINGVVVANIDLALVFIFMISSLNVYSILGAGWSSNSRYAFLGSLRAAAQVISYEIIMGVSFLLTVVISQSYNLTDIVEMQRDCPFILTMFPFFVLFFIAILAETNRVPFDLPEAESELVSGYNVEYSGFMFTLFFLAEYATIILFSNVIAILFLGGWVFPDLGIFSLFVYLLKVIFVLFCFVLIRGVLPRYRYDQLMMLGWTILMPVAFGLFFFHIAVFFFFFV
uniref:NADH-ubiquinone oxidoreductase chain 1 n=1 Tax=Balamuthia mandrillaris TaxID=66527 RepID=A0A0K1HNR5_9EUKA|nr:NADH dehydrogenase subunit 1 [Balamuthia mandrillaris]AKT93790.1 NADH dehydrogenase subunit 1 [Balamuthia mandrillaris]AKT93868.1 NADH dehydrogenase subunit 1 [Balamuthia mandrillaris]